MIYPIKKGKRMGKANSVEFIFESNFDNKEYLIEASAGTGKTHCLAQLFIKFILDGIPADKIILVTFTNAAAQEIKDRILIFLFEVKAYFEKKDVSLLRKIKDDKLLLGYIDSLKEKNPQEIGHYILNLEKAIFDFDKIISSTIHSFTIRLCKEFESELGLGFNYEFAKDYKRLNFEILKRFLYDNQYLIKDFNNIINEDKANELKNNEIKIKTYDYNFIKQFLELQKFIENQRLSSADANYSVDIEEKYFNQFFKFYTQNSFNLKMELKDFSFNDSIELLLKNLSSNSSIKEKISKRFEVLIVDEFQDTDKMQVELFQKIFSGKKVFYIGDPKQSIYGFRGGDLYNYLNIENTIPEENKIKLFKTYRSTKVVTYFINRFSELLYVYEDYKTDSEDKSLQIKYKEVESARQDSDNIFSEVNIYEIPAEKENKYSFYKKIATRIIQKIEELKRKDENLNLGDIAILIKNKVDIETYYRIFTEKKFPVALKIFKSVFKTDEAIFIYYLLSAIIYKNRITEVKRLVSTNYFTFSFDYINRNIASIYSELILPLETLHQDWEKHGIFSVFENIFLNSIFPIKYFNPFTIKDYERRLTNIRQIFEFLAINFSDQDISLNNQLDFLKNLISQNFDEDQMDLSSMRLENEENAVIISTIHSAKGLEYNTVFCPKLFVNASINKGTYIYYEEDNGYWIKKFRLSSNIKTNKDTKKDLKNKINKKIRDTLNLQNYNTFYVATTRAKNNLYIFIEKDEEKEDENSEKNKNNINKLIKNLKRIYPIDYDSFEEKKLEIDIKENNLSKISNIKKAEELDTGIFNEKIENSYSYSSIVHIHNLPKESEKTRKIALEYVIDFKPFTQENSYDFEERYSSFMGKIAGNIFHETMQNIFNNKQDIKEEINQEFIEKIKNISEKIIIKYYRSKDIIKNFVDENTNLVINTLKAEIPLLKKRIIDIDNALSEVEFFAKARKNNLLSFYKACNRKVSEKELKEVFINGYYRGFIDLLFIENNTINIIDWKTNNLSDLTQEDFQGNVIDKNIIDRAMIKNNYDIQYYLYSAAVYKYIKVNKLPYDFINIYYFFVRYVDEKNNNGVYSKKIDKDQLEELSKILLE